MKTMLLVFFLCSAQFSFASILSLLPLHDTVAPPGPYKLNKNEFLEKYGRDDSSRALILFYFRKRKIDQTNFYAGAFLALIGGIAVFPVKNLPDMGDYNSLNYSPSDKLAFSIGIVCLLAAGIPLLLTGGSLLLRYNRKRLLKMLDNYFTGKFIPRGIVGNKYFKTYLKSGR